MVEKAKELCEDLLTNVREAYEEFKARPPRSFGGGYGDRPREGSYQGYNRDNHHQNNQGGNGYNGGATHGAGSTASPTPGNASGAADYAAQYAQYYGGAADPYAAYGGYEAYAQMYQQWMASQGGQQTAAAAAGSSGSPPPPPPNEAAPPPPPPSAAPPPPPSGAPPGAPSGYNAVSLGCGNASFHALTRYRQVPPPPGL